MDILDGLIQLGCTNILLGSHWYRLIRKPANEVETANTLSAFSNLYFSIYGPVCDTEKILQKHASLRQKEH